MEPTPGLERSAVRRGVPRAQLFRIGWWFTLGLWLLAALLPRLFGGPGVLSALALADLFSWQTVLGGLLGLVLGLAVVQLVLHWPALQIVARRLAALLAWDTFRTRDYFIIALLAALGEEPLFRGVLQPLIGLLPAALIFGLLHATAVPHIILATVLGLVLGWLFQWGGSLWPPIMAHLMIDLVTALFLARALEPAKSPARGD